MAEKHGMEALRELTDIMAKLRSPAGCPWDQEQTAKTLKPYILEEAYELLEAIDSENTLDICDELGDLLLQVVFMAQIFREQNKFDLTDVALSISQKLIRRHPHVFADASQVGHARRWEEIKQQERSTRGKGNKLADRIPVNLPALKKATKVAKKIEGESSAAQIHKIQQNFSELLQFIDEQAADKDHLEQVLANILFRTTQLAHSLHLDAEDLLRKKTIQVMTEFEL